MSWRTLILLDVDPGAWPSGFQPATSYEVEIPGAPEGDTMSLSSYRSSTCQFADPPVVRRSDYLQFIGSGPDVYHGWFRSREMSSALAAAFEDSGSAPKGELLWDFELEDSRSTYRPFSLSLQTAHGGPALTIRLTGGGSSVEVGTSRGVSAVPGLRWTHNSRRSHFSARCSVVPDLDSAQCSFTYTEYALRDAKVARSIESSIVVPFPSEAASWTKRPFVEVSSAYDLSCEWNMVRLISMTLSAREVVFR